MSKCGNLKVCSGPKIDFLQLSHTNTINFKKYLTNLLLYKVVFKMKYSCFVKDIELFLKHFQSFLINLKWNSSS